MINSMKSNERNSNIELLRIIAMFFIIAHHYVVNSNVTSLFDYSNISTNMIFLQIFGMFGKIAINIFTLITGYFMVNKTISKTKFLSLFCKVKFYYILFFFLFVFTGYQSFSINSLFKAVFPIIAEAGKLYVGTYLIFYLFIPFLNNMIWAIDKRKFQLLVLLLLFYFTIIPTFFFNNTFSFLGWLCTIYLIGAYIKIYNIEKILSKKKFLLFMVLSILLSIASVIVVDYMGVKFGFYNAYHMVNDSNKLLAVTTSILIFIYFLNIRIHYSSIINMIGASTFSILLIHANGDAVREFYGIKYLILLFIFILII